MYSLGPFIWLYFIMLFIIMIINGFGRYNSLPVLCYCLLFLSYINNFVFYRNFLLLSLIIGIGSFINGCSILHIVLDCAEAFLILATVQFSDRFYIKPSDMRKASYILYMLIIASIICMWGSSFYSYSDGALRYDGIFARGNSSANTFLMLVIFLLELTKRMFRKPFFQKLCLLFISIAILLYIVTSQTRSLLFILPYLYYQFYKLYNRKIVLTAGVIGLILVSGYYLISIQEKLRLTSDNSFMTRTFLYEGMIDGIVENYILIPHGVHRAWELAIDMTGSDQFSPHNDFLKYLYDWGGAFILLIVLCYRKMKSNNSLNLELLLIIIAQSSCMLHNMWFLPVVWMPLFFILCLNNNYPVYEK